MTLVSAKKIILLSLGILVLSVLFRNIYLYLNFCQPSYDLGIFVEMMIKNSQGVFNPFLNIRQIHQFNDHNTIIITLLSPLNWILPQPYLLLLIELISILFVLVFLYLEYKKKYISVLQFAFLASFFCLSREVYEALYFAVHPAVWATPFLFYWFILIKNHNWDSSNLTNKSKRIFLIIYTVTCLTDEQFSFVGIGFALALLVFSSEKKYALLFLFYSILVVYLCNQGRQLLLGNLYPYYHLRLAKDFNTIIEHYPITKDSIKSFLLHALSVLPGIWLVFLGRREKCISKWKPFFIMLGVIGPLLLGRFLVGSWGLHYGIILSLFWLTVFYYLIPESVFTLNRVFICFLIFLAFGASKIKKAILPVTHREHMICIRGKVSEQELNIRNFELKKIFSILDDVYLQNKQLKILTSGNLGPNMLVEYPLAQIFHMGSYQIENTDKFDWVVLENNKFGENSFASVENLNIVISRIREMPMVQILVDTENLFVAKGSILRPPLDDRFQRPPMSSASQ